jgi:hypothetical protein
MSNLTHKFAKTAAKHSLTFDLDMYSNIVGSLVITHYVLALLDNEEVDKANIRKVWKSIKKKGLDFWIDDKEFVTKALALFGMKPKFGRFAMCQSEFNMLFLPYIEGQVMPIREDGIFPLSARNGKIYPVEEKVDETEQRDKE